jgi:hypothetical protein
LHKEPNVKLIYTVSMNGEENSRFIFDLNVSEKRKINQLVGYSFFISIRPGLMGSDIEVHLE